MHQLTYINNDIQKWRENHAKNKYLTIKDEKKKEYRNKKYIYNVYWNLLLNVHFFRMKYEIIFLKLGYWTNFFLGENSKFKNSSLLFINF